MAVSRQKKEQQLDLLKQELAKAQSIIVAGYQGITVEQVNQLRRRCREQHVVYRVVKNTIAGIAMKDTAHEALGQKLHGPVALAYSLEDPLAPAKVLVAVAKDNNKVQIQAGIIEGQVLDAEGVRRLAAMPGKNELRQQFLGLLLTPARNVLSVMLGVPRKVLNVLQARSGQLEKKAA